MFIESGKDGFEVVDAPDGIVYFFKPDVLVLERLRQAEPVILETEYARSAYPPDFKVSWVFGLRQMRRHLSYGILIQRCWRDAADPLMRSVVIEVIDKVIKAILLRRVVELRWMRGHSLERFVHPFMARILPRLTRGDTLLDDAEFDEPDAKPRQTQHAVRSEGHPVVSADCFGQPVLMEDRLEVKLGLETINRLMSSNSKHIATILITGRQTIAVLSIAQSKLALVVQAPDLIGGGCHQWHSFGLRLRSLPLRFDQIVTLENITGRRICRQLKLRIRLAKTVDDHGSAPARMALARFNDEIFDLGCGLMGAAPRSPTTVCKTGFAAFVKTIEPLVAGLAAYAKTVAQLAHLPHTREIGFYEVGTFLHGTSLVPRHSIRGW